MNLNTSLTERPAKIVKPTKPFIPDFAYFEPGALEYPKGERILKWVQSQGIPYKMTSSHNRITGLPGETDLEKYKNAKRTLVVGVRKTLTFDQSKPSAEYAIPISTGCMGHCHYCYLQTTLGAKPYIRVYVNTEDILGAAKNYINERIPEITRFEAACTSDPVGLEHITGSLEELITFMANEEYGRLRFVTKYHHVDPLLHVKHNGHTRIRFSINADYVIRQFEPGTSRFEERIEAAGKIARAGYPLGFIIAPIIWYEGWEDGYASLLERLAAALPREPLKDMTFEMIQHRFTKTAKRVIEQRYPKTKLDMDIAKRKMKWGRYGQYKYVYPDEQQTALREFITEQIFEHFPAATIDYFT
ncbi:spore photoproduct lyase [Paenibacillus sp. CAA11]|uniref:spore photoproduct lyase n=1 Tax=Paenibacillus sp. CAA11 TaxID=1532905 RepID=UPI000D3C34C1|nr:spore photoproduct lyase [Paenibacillus sp. CAA11]AWB45117.1 spore photoproduct lyase [Paenibacillus sp. CAA11]